MFCPNCGMENPDTATACRRCRAPFEEQHGAPAQHEEQAAGVEAHAPADANEAGAICGRCETFNEPGVERCTTCGYPLHGGEAASAEASEPHAEPAHDATPAEAHPAHESHDEPGSTHMLEPVAESTPAEGHAPLSSSSDDELAALELSPEDARAARGEDATPAEGSAPIRTEEHRLDLPPAGEAIEEQAPAAASLGHDEPEVTPRPAKAPSRSGVPRASAPPAPAPKPPSSPSARAIASAPPAAAASADKVCPNCGEVNPPNAKFCAECGTPFPKIAAAAKPKPPPEPEPIPEPAQDELHAAPAPELHAESAEAAEEQAEPAPAVDPLLHTSEGVSIEHAMEAAIDQHTPEAGSEEEPPLDQTPAEPMRVAPPARIARGHEASSIEVDDSLAEHQEPEAEAVAHEEQAEPAPEEHGEPASAEPLEAAPEEHAEPREAGAEAAFDPTRTDQTHAADPDGEHTSEQPRISIADDAQASEADDPGGVAPLSAELTAEPEAAPDPLSVSIESVQVAAFGDDDEPTQMEGAPEAPAGDDLEHTPAEPTAIADDGAMGAEHAEPAEAAAEDAPAEEAAAEAPQDEQGELGGEALQENLGGELAAEAPPEEQAAEEPIAEEPAAPQPPPFTAMLVIDEGEQAGQSFHLAAMENPIGGGAGTAVELADEHLAPHQATAFFEADKLFLRDEGAANGVYVKVREAAALQPGDQFIAGRRLLRFEGPVELVSESGELPLQGAPRPASGAVRLVELLAGGKRGRTCHRAGPVIAVGKSGCDLNFGSDDLLAPRHAEIHLGEDGSAQLVDLGAVPAGVLLRVRPGATVELQPGDVLQLGGQTLRVDIEAQ